MLPVDAAHEEQQNDQCEGQFVHESSFHSLARIFRVPNSTNLGVVTELLPTGSG